LSTWASYEQFFITHLSVIVPILILLQVGFIVAILFVAIKLSKLRKRYLNLINVDEENNLEEILLQVGERLKRLEDGFQDINQQVDEQRRASQSHLQKWALLRYKAFSNTGGDQSFSMAVLDGKGSGVVVSSIYGRDESRVYAKSIHEGQSTYALSSEEEEALKQALLNEKNK
jgi:hypothetical protein